MQDNGTGTDLVQHVEGSAVELGFLRGTTPAELLEAAAQIATPLASMIEKQRLFVTIGGRRHVLAEGWSTLLAMLGIVPVERECKRLPVQVKHPGTGELVDSIAYEITVELHARDGRVVGAASAECGGPDEPSWHFRPRGSGRQRTYEAVPPNARRSMASTRALGKAARQSAAWVLSLAGFETQPAEEFGRARFAGEAEVVRGIPSAFDALPVRDDGDIDWPAAYDLGPSPLKSVLELAVRESRYPWSDDPAGVADAYQDARYFDGVQALWQWCSASVEA